MKRKEYGPLIDQHAARSDGPALGDEGPPSRGSRKAETGIEMRNSVGSGRDRKASPKTAAYQQLRPGDPLADEKARTIKFNNFNFVLRGIPSNKINNQKYSFFSFLPVVLFDQFKHFYNLFFLLVCLS